MISLRRAADETAGHMPCHLHVQLSRHPLTIHRRFYPAYLEEHSAKSNRALHVAGTSLALLALVGAAATGKLHYLLTVPVANFGLAWAGHAACEEKKKKSWGHPLYSLMGGLKLWWETVTLQRAL
jgi:hypothetical protein